MIRLISFILLLTTLVVWPSDFEARRAYLNKNYNLALKSYLSLVEYSPKNAAYQYNLGATYYRLGDLLNAKKHFLKSLKTNPKDKDTEENLNIINQQLIDQELFFKTHWYPIFGWSISAVTAIFLIGAIPLLLLNMASFKKPSFSLIKRPLIVLLFLWCAGLVSLLFLYKNEPNYGLITAKKATIYSGPSETQNILFYAHIGSEFKILRNATNWQQIQFSNGLKGWIKAIDTVEI